MASRCGLACISSCIRKVSGLIRYRASGPLRGTSVYSSENPPSVHGCSPCVTRDKDLIDTANLCRQAHKPWQCKSRGGVAKSKHPWHCHATGGVAKINSCAAKRLAVPEGCGLPAVVDGTPGCPRNRHPSRSRRQHRGHGRSRHVGPPKADRITGCCSSQTIRFPDRAIAGPSICVVPSLRPRELECAGGGAELHHEAVGVSR